MLGEILLGVTLAADTVTAQQAENLRDLALDRGEVVTNKYALHDGRDYVNIGNCIMWRKSEDPRYSALACDGTDKDGYHIGMLATRQLALNPTREILAVDIDVDGNPEFCFTRQSNGGISLHAEEVCSRVYEEHVEILEN